MRRNRRKEEKKGGEGGGSGRGVGKGGCRRQEAGWRWGEEGGGRKAHVGKVIPVA